MRPLFLTLAGFSVRQTAMRFFHLLAPLAFLFAQESLALDMTPAKKEETSLQSLMGDLSEALSSTNPEKYPSSKPSQNAPKKELSQEKPQEKQIVAPTTPIPAPPVSAPAPTPAPAPAPSSLPEIEVKTIPQKETPPPAPSKTSATLVPEVRLPAETKQILNSIPSGVGSPESKQQKLNIQRGEFDQGGGWSPPAVAPAPPPAPDKETSLSVPPATPAPADTPKKATDMGVEVKISKPDIDLGKQLDIALDALLSGQYEGAVSLYKTVLRKDPANRDALFGLAVAYQKNGQRVQARKAYGDLLKRYPDFQDGLNNFLVLASEEAPQDALIELEKLLKRNPDFAPIYAQKALILSRMNRDDEAIRELSLALSYAPDNVTYKYNLAVLFDRKGSKQEAAKLYLQVLEAGFRGATLPASQSEIQERLTFLSR